MHTKRVLVGDYTMNQILSILSLPGERISGFAAARNFLITRAEIPVPVRLPPY